MPENIIQPAQLQQGQMVEGEDYEYSQSSYLDQLRDELAAMRNQYELEAEDKRVNGPLGERNMAILNSALMARSSLQGLRDSHIARLKDKYGGQGNAGVIQDEEGIWRTASGDIAKFVNKTQVQDSNKFNEFLGWHDGIVELTDGMYTGESEEEDVSASTGLTKDEEKDSEVTSNTQTNFNVSTEEKAEDIVEDVTSAVAEDKPIGIEYKDMDTLDLVNSIDPSNEDMDTELVEEFQRRVGLKVDGMFGPNTTAAWQDAKGIQVDEDDGDLPADPEWDNNISNNNESSNDIEESISEDNEAPLEKEDSYYNIEIDKETWNEMYDKSLTSLQSNFDSNIVQQDTVVKQDKTLVDTNNTQIDFTNTKPVVETSKVYEELKKKYPNSILQGY